MWDIQPSKNATARANELAPRINRLIVAARDCGAIIVHAPSGCMNYYKEHSARKNMRNIPSGSKAMPYIQQWHAPLLREDTSEYPIDDSGDKNDDDPEEQSAWVEQLRQQGLDINNPSNHQIDVIEIHDTDFISDSGQEIWNLIEYFNIDQVFIMGIHLNFCVLSRPFGLRQMISFGKNVYLVRDLTDSFYDPERAPFVDHFSATDMVISYIETYICGTVSSEQFLGGAPFVFKDNKIEEEM